MRVVRLTDSPAGPVLIETEAPKPKPGPEEILVRVHAAGVTPTELVWYPTSHTQGGERRSGAIPGHEFSGVIAEAGTNAGPVEIGQAVFGMSDWFADGAMAEYCVTRLSSVAPKPPALSHVDAASVPIGALTAWQGLFDRARVQPDEWVLVQGGAGAVGLFAVQLAKYRGARVITTASGRNVEFVQDLGPEQVIDYQKTRFEEIVKNVDVVFDTVGGETLARSWSVLKPGGRMVTVAASSEAPTEPRVKEAFFIVEPNRDQLTKVGELISTGKLKTFVDTTVPLLRAADAFTGRIERRGRGKVVVVVNQ
jgi:NADPH:quinone reductase-like Zn-dependent oxidoreductase